MPTLTVLPGEGLKEKEIQEQVLSYLWYNHVFCWRNNSVGIFDATKKVFRKPGRFFLPGVADILGVYQSRFLALEIKSATGKLSEHQKFFIDEVNYHGGIGIVIRSIDDIDKKLFLKYGRP